MNSNPRHFLFVLTALILPAVGTVSAAEPAEVSAPAASSNLHFRTLGWDNIQGINYSAGGKDVPVVIYGKMISQSYVYQGPPTLNLYRLKTDNDGKVVREVVAKADLTHAGPFPLLIITADPQNPEGIKLTVLSDDYQAFPKGSYRVINNTAASLLGAVGPLTFTVDANSIKSVTMPGDAAPPTVYVSFSSDNGEQKTPVYGNRWPYNATDRTLIFFYTDQQIIRPLLVLDSIPPDPKPSANL